VKESEDLRSLQLTLGLYVLIFAMKLVVYLLSGVMALLAEALHTLADIFVAAFLLVAMVYSRRKADTEHAFGHGRVQYVAALVAATLFVSFTSFQLYREAIPRLFSAHEAGYANLPLAIGVLVLSMLLAALPLVKLLRQKMRGAAAKAQMMELVNDELGLLAALLGTLCIVWGWPLGDPLAAVVVATIIAVNAIGLFRENLSYLMGRSPEPECVSRVETSVRGVPGVIGFHSLKAEYIGPESLHGELHIVVRRGTSIEEADRIAEEVRDQVEQATGCRHCLIHVDPEGPEADLLEDQDHPPEG
jgi:cation diffusion facilitator family transporter